MGQVEGKVAIVTGGASGIGAACAATLAREGAKMVVTDLDDTGGRDVADKISGAGGEAIFLHQDVSLEESWPGVIEATERRFGCLNVMVANAGIGILCKAVRETATLTHADWLGLLVDRELTHRRDKRLTARLRYARLRQQASVEDVDYRAPRGLDRALFHKLTNGEWIDAHDNLILCGPTGVGKSWLACALGHKACRDNRSVLYQRVPKLHTAPLCGIDQSPFPRDGYRVAGGEAAGINGLRRHPTSSVPHTGRWLKSTRKLRNCQFIIARIAR